MNNNIHLKRNRITRIDSLQLAIYILAKCGAMNHLKVHKLIYYVEAYHLAYFNASVINEEFEAWVHGPVVKRVWRAFRERANVYDGLIVNPEHKKPVMKEVKRMLGDEQFEFINDVLDEFNKRTAYELECLTHNELPWIQARKGIDPNRACSNTISKNEMRLYYRKKLLT